MINRYKDPQPKPAPVVEPTSTHLLTSIVNKLDELEKKQCELASLVRELLVPPEFRGIATEPAPPPTSPVVTTEPTAEGKDKGKAKRAKKAL